MRLGRRRRFFPALKILKSECVLASAVLAFRFRGSPPSNVPRRLFVWVSVDADRAEFSSPSVIQKRGNGFGATHWLWCHPTNAGDTCDWGETRDSRTAKSAKRCSPA